MEEKKTPSTKKKMFVVTREWEKMDSKGSMVVSLCKTWEKATDDFSISYKLAMNNLAFLRLFGGPIFHMHYREIDTGLKLIFAIISLTGEPIGDYEIIKIQETEVE